MLLGLASGLTLISNYLLTIVSLRFSYFISWPQSKHENITQVLAWNFRLIKVNIPTICPQTACGLRRQNALQFQHQKEKKPPTKRMGNVRFRIAAAIKRKRSTLKHPRLFCASNRAAQKRVVYCYYFLWWSMVLCGFAGLPLQRDIAHCYTFQL